MRIGSLEAGGTKMVCAIGDENGSVFEKLVLPTLSPDVTMPKMLDYFKERNVEALGIGCFGPICLDKTSPEYGSITSTPKLEWKNYPIVNEFKKALGVPIGFDTDVNAACLGEATFGCAKGLKNVIYLTIGTGIGAGIIVEGNLLHGNLHPEAGHIQLRRHPDDKYDGKCPYHLDCFEGLAAGPAIEERWHKPAKELAEESIVWEIEAYYIAQALATYILILAPDKIILGGGVMHQMQLFKLVRRYVKEILAGYIQTNAIEDIDNYIVPASLHDEQGIIGGLCLGKEAYGSGN
ncbi:MAG: ROK family protein [Lachnospiraceae bacterium]|nr:ROK family protein [Lachnospiraceae bacterium]